MGRARPCEAVSQRSKGRRQEREGKEERVVALAGATIVAVVFPRAIVIGAGPAGSIAAMLLARAQWDVTLVEQHRFPRDKVCGECLSSLGVDVLTRLDLDTTVRAYGAIPL